MFCGRNACHGGWRNGCWRVVLVSEAKHQGKDIENIKAGDKVISTNHETFETAEKTVLETYIREDSKLIHLVIN